MHMERGLEDFQIVLYDLSLVVGQIEQVVDTVEDTHRGNLENLLISSERLPTGSPTNENKRKPPPGEYDGSD